MAPVTLKYQTNQKPFPIQDDVLFVNLAREIAMNISELDTILKRYEVTPKQWERIQRHHRFDELLKAAIVEWQSAINTEERIKVKSATLLEAWLEEANSRLHDRTEGLAAKTELAKFLAKLSHLGLGAAGDGESGSKFSVTINLGGDAKLSFEKPLPPKVIDVTPTQE